MLGQDVEDESWSRAGRCRSESAAHPCGFIGDSGASGPAAPSRISCEVGREADILASLIRTGIDAQAYRRLRHQAVRMSVTCIPLGRR